MNILRLRVLNRLPLMESRGLVLVSMATGLETLNIAKKWLCKISIIQPILLVAFAGKKTTKKGQKNAINLKNST